MVGKNKILIFTVLVVFLFVQGTGLSQPLQDNIDQTSALAYPFKLYSQKDYYRAVTEAKRLTFGLKSQTDIVGLRFLMLKSYYHLGEEAPLEKMALELLRNPDPDNNELRVKTAIIYSRSLLNQDRAPEAKALWEKYVSLKFADRFPLPEKIKGRIDPEAAKLYSTILPGAGFFLSGEYAKGSLSFLLNSVFIIGAYQLYQKRQFAAAG
ncbi:MAG: hypothetical protein OEY59_12775, partial [Deltaproteobacteria bacterium]|nr:hypothetical protein [Deltaproteobacteria bacterium]